MKKQNKANRKHSMLINPVPGARHFIYDPSYNIHNNFGEIYVKTHFEKEQQILEDLGREPTYVKSPR